MREFAGSITTVVAMGLAYMVAAILFIVLFAFAAINAAASFAIPLLVIKNLFG